MERLYGENAIHHRVVILLLRSPYDYGNMKAVEPGDGPRARQAPPPWPSVGNFNQGRGDPHLTEKADRA